MSMTMAVTQHVELDQLSGRQKVAILCMAIGAEAAAKITQRLPADEAEAVAFEIARLDGVSGKLANAVLTEWNETMRASDYLAEGGAEYARELLEKAFGPQKAAAMFKRLQTQMADTVGLERLRKADPQQLGNMLRNEHPQTVALVLAHLQPTQTAAILKELEPAVGGEVMYRIACMEKVSPEMLQLIERSLGIETELNMQGMSSSGGPAAVAAVLNLLAPSLEKELLDGVSARSQELSDQIKNLMFVFEDIVQLDDRGLQRLLREIDSKELAMALKAASEELRDRILGVMTQRAVAALKEEMDFLGPVKMRDVEAAQTRVVAQARALEEAGELDLGSGGDDDMVV